jgi:hypothetical protein
MKVHYLIHISLKLVCIVVQMYQVYTTVLSFKISFNIISNLYLR